MSEEKRHEFGTRETLNFGDVLPYLDDRSSKVNTTGLYMAYTIVKNKPLNKNDKPFNKKFVWRIDEKDQYHLDMLAKRSNYLHAARSNNDEYLLGGYVGTFCFTWKELCLLQTYLDENFKMRVNATLLKLHRENTDRVIEPVEENDKNNSYLLFNEPGYSLPFKVWARIEYPQF